MSLQRLLSKGVGHAFHHGEQRTEIDRVSKESTSTSRVPQGFPGSARWRRQCRRCTRFRSQQRRCGSCWSGHEIGRMPIAYRGKDERVERVLMYYCTSSLLALVQDVAEEPSTYCFADTLETKRDALSARRGSCQKSEKLISTPCVVFRDRNPL